MTSTIKEISIQGKDAECFLFSKITDGKNLSIHIINTKNSEAYFGSANESDLRCMAAEFRMPFNEFCSEMRNAISSENLQNLQFIYTLDDESEEDNYQFKWKKVLDGGSIKITLGCVAVRLKEFAIAVSEFLSQTSVSLYTLSTKLQDVTDTMHKTEKEKAAVESVLEEAVKVKENLEKEMYTKFLIILNSKKRKLKELYETLEFAKSKKSKAMPDNKKIFKTSAPIEVKSNCGNARKAGPSKLAKKTFDETLSFSDEEIDLPVRKTRQIRRRKQDTCSKLPRIESDCDKIVISDDDDDDDRNYNGESIDGLLDVL